MVDTNDATSYSATTESPPRTKESSSSVNCRALFLSALGAIQWIALWSYYLQFPALLSTSGIAPLLMYFEHTTPWLYEQWDRLGIIDEDSMCELMAVVGMVVAAVIASGYCQHGLLLGISAGIYSILVRLGFPFYRFQWDMLLLEAMTVTCLTYAPWTKMRPNDKSTATQSSVAQIPLRFLLFKLMYMSGIVKLQAQCPTWENLTALEYHFATQCLPGPLSWYFHQLPPFVLRLGVAMTLWIEIPAAILVLLPFRTMRRFGAILQVALQAMIILSGNYNFFNLLTIAMCIPVWESHSNSDIPLDPRIQKAVLVALTVASSFSMFRIERTGPNQQLNIVMSQESIWTESEVALPYILYGMMATILVSTVASFLRSKSFATILHGLTCFLVVGMTAVPLSVTPFYPGESLFIQKSFEPLVAKIARPYLLISSYGLFRRMTGVGKVQPSGETGWAGLPPSLVARPEIVVEGVFGNISNEDSEEVWEELQLFRWKPSFVDVMPWQVAPHQPRLDWQMWFAALGSVNSSPWMVSFLQKVIQGCDPVLDLATDDFRNERRPLQRVRARLFHYDFTRLNTTWSRTIPGTETLEATTLVPSRVWSRQFVRDYVPPVTEEDLSRYLSPKGYTLFCKDSLRPCDNIRTNKFWCVASHAIRISQICLLPPLVAISWFLLVRRYRARRSLVRLSANDKKTKID